MSSKVTEDSESVVFMGKGLYNMKSVKLNKCENLNNF